MGRGGWENFGGSLIGVLSPDRRLYTCSVSSGGALGRTTEVERSGWSVHR